MFQAFTNQYPVLKTLRFELKPINETTGYLEDFKSAYLKKVVGQDEKRASDYQAIKKIIDNYHRHYIDQCLVAPCDEKTGELFITPEQMEDAFSYFQAYREKPDEKGGKEGWMKTQKTLRANLVKAFKDNGSLFKEDLIKRLLPEWLQQQGTWEECREAVESFSKFTTYFTGFHENRKNIYSSEDHSSAISNRLMNENLPRFFNNCIQYTQLREKYPELGLNAPANILQALNASTLDKVFQPGFYLNLFTQRQISHYQELLGGKTTDTGEKQQGLNEQINLFRQKTGLRPRELPGFTPLYKQILSDVESHSFVPEAFASDRQLLDALAAFIMQMDEKMPALMEQLDGLEQADQTKTHIKAQSLGTVSQALFHSWGIIGVALARHAESLFPANAKGVVTKAIEEQREKYGKQETYPLAEVDQVLTGYISTLEQDDPLHQQLKALSTPDKPLLAYFRQAAIQTQVSISPLKKQLAELLILPELSKDRQLPKDDQETGGQGFQQVQRIKALLDAYKALVDVFKPLHLVKGRKAMEIPDLDNGFYSMFEETYATCEQPVVALYNKTRNYLSQKPFSADKIKLNFEDLTTTLLNGWDVNKETANGNILLEKDGLYYLGILHPKHKRLFDYVKDIDDFGNAKMEQKKDVLRTSLEAESGELGYRKIVYKLLPGANKMLPKVFFSASRIGFFQPSSDIQRIRDTASHSKNGTPQPGHKKADFSLSDCHAMIDFFKASIEKHPEWREFGFQFSPTHTYVDMSGFYREVEQQGYRIDFHRIKASYIDECVKDGKLFLFQIYNKDFSPHSKGAPNLHTLYWKGLFDPENLKDVVIKLNGEAEIFYRKHSIRQHDRIIHRAGQPVANKSGGNPKRHSLFEYDLIKDRRYTQDKFQFHVPITLNFKAAGVNAFNDRINTTLAGQQGTHVIGIDRGERHLLYYTVINPRGEIVEQGTLNTVEVNVPTTAERAGYQYGVDYQKMLDAKESERDKARTSWAGIENIKELKEGYLSHIVHKLAKLITRYNAIVCLENLNAGFKRGRFKVEKQVYQKFEKALIEKLNYLVFKDAKPGEAGHFLRAYQLTAPFEGFNKLYQQTGILYYVRADYTSKIDPATGFIDFLRPNYESVEKSAAFFRQFDAIRYNVAKDYFEFSFDYKKFQTRQRLESYPTRWTACTHGDTRYHNKRDKNGQWHTETINVTEQIKALLQQENIGFEQGQDIREAIAGSKDSPFFKSLLFLLRLTLSLRHSRTGTDDDFILSPVANELEEFFDSRKAGQNLPKDADANGAYHIALKGLWNLQQIRQHDWSVAKPQPLKLNLSNEEWFGFVQGKPYLKG